jgi:hypothetical protein
MEEVGFWKTFSYRCDGSPDLVALGSVREVRFDLGLLVFLRVGLVWISANRKRVGWWVVVVS